MAVLRDYLFAIRRFSPAVRVFLLSTLLIGQGKAVSWVLMNLYLRELGWPEDLIGSTRSAAALGMVLIGVPMAFGMDRRGLKPFLIASGLLVAGALIVLWRVHTVPVVMTVSFILGAGTSLTMIAAPPFFMRNSTEQERPYLFSIGLGATSFALFLGGLNIAFLTRLWADLPLVEAYRRIILVGAACAAASAVVLTMFLRDAAPAPAPADGDGRRLPAREAGRLCLPEFLIGFGAGLTIPFINLYFKGRFGQNADTVGIYFAIAELFTVAGYLLAPLMARRIGAVRAVVACQMLSIPFFLTLAFTMSLPVALAAFFGRQILMNMAHPVGSKFAMDIVPPHQRARVNGIKHFMWNSAWVGASSLGGWLIRHAPTHPDGFAAVMLVTITLYLMGSASYYLFFSRWKVAPTASVDPARP